MTLVLSLLVMNRLLSKLGVPTVMMVLPVLYLLAFGVLTVASTFAILLAFRFVQVVWLQGGASSAWEAVINTVPGDRRDRMRAFLYGGPTQVGTVLAGIVAMIGERAVSPRVLFAIGLVVAGAAVYSMIRVRRAYAAELVAALREGRPHVFGAGPGAGEPFGLARADRAAAAVAIGAMTDPDAGVRRVAAELLGGFETPGAVPALIARRARRRSRGPGDGAPLARPDPGVRRLGRGPGTPDRSRPGGPARRAGGARRAPRGPVPRPGLAGRPRRARREPAPRGSC